MITAPPVYKARTLSPIIPVSNVSRSTDFYREVLGFETSVHAESYAVLTRGSASLHLTKAENEEVLKVTHGNISVYLEVEEIASLWAHVAAFRDRYKIRDLFDRDYGMREFHILDPDGCLIFVGQKIQTATTTP